MMSTQATRWPEKNAGGFGQPGRDALVNWLPGFREERVVDFVIANGTNAANGAGITSKLALTLLGGGVRLDFGG